ncbi:metalloregulator ArsR/SmtB family transcription factor [Mesorhizobium sp. BR1-1-16]|uniref:ArsR/SmtB family transcription factor n=1 Tax=Mesorhizobium sp. BR1-1-16 TaxID=2876653 RepID=UPI001CCF5655|nr:metalloregulator ArsR/SmtB family transcription factor [Mesorhizobium sp. BR1-1-16]MBZ9936565.1 metalloregulator ArsR/SmtB family transcription factor [Mesorhizobium sp. BR1-1-16]
MSGGTTVQHLEVTAPIFAALGDPSRLSIIERLGADGPLPTTRLNGPGSGVTRQGITKHLRVLENAGLVESFRVGRDRLWRLRTEQLVIARGYLDQVSAEWDGRLARLKSLVESGSE